MQYEFDAAASSEADLLGKWLVACICECANLPVPAGGASQAASGATGKRGRVRARGWRDGIHNSEDGAESGRPRLRRRTDRRRSASESESNLEDDDGDAAEDAGSETEREQDTSESESADAE
jgi:hypothetical protein